MPDFLTPLPGQAIRLPNGDAYTSDTQGYIRGAGAVDTAALLALGCTLTVAPPINSSVGLAYAAAGPLIAPTLITCGDSQLADGVQAPGTTYLGRVITWLMYKLRNRYTHDFTLHQFAQSGITTANWITTFLTQAIAAGVAARAAGSVPVYLFKLGTNTVASGGGAPPSYASCKADYETIFSALTAIGGIVCPVLILPRAAGAALTPNGEKLRNGINAYLSALRLQGQRRIVPIDTIRAMTTGAGVPTPGFLIDGLHPTPAGADAEATAIANVLNALCPFDGIQDFVFPSDVYDATYAPLGNHLTIGALTGTTGTLANAQATGTPPTGWTAGAFADAVQLNTAGTHITGALSQVASALAPEAGAPMTQIALGGTASSEFVVLQPANFPSGAGFVGGDQVQVGVEVEWDAGLANVAAVGMVCDFWFNATIQEGQSLDGATPLPSGAHRYMLLSNPGALPAGYEAGNTNLRVRLFVQGATAGAPSGAVRFGQAFIRKLGPF